ncbi:conserved hypothetical protein [metagenome]|uniref:Uncharacterized protein n=1 Tax=metagenome TaxID=256318 RepID=A0A2P2BX02_9ZZZZ
MRQTLVPDAIPVLSPGRHRTPRKGACFMEFASYLAGERWSDHPGCTHPALAALARGVNDSVSDEARGELVSLIPEVVGLTGDEPSLDLWIALHAAQAAIRIAPETRQRVLALAIMKAESELAEAEGREPGTMTTDSRKALDDAPGARSWAQGYLREHEPARVRPSNVAAVLENAMIGINQSVSPHKDALLVGLLSSAIAHFQTVLAAEQPAPAALPGDAHDLGAVRTS